MEFVYPVVVFFVNGAFHSYVPSVGNHVEFVREYVVANGISFDTLEAFLYNRKDWITMLLESKESDISMTIEKDRVLTTRSIQVDDVVEVPVDWMKEDGLDEFYSEGEITKINENKEELLNYTFVTEEVLAGLPHKIAKKYRIVEVKKNTTEIVTELIGVPLIVTALEETEEL